MRVNNRDKGDKMSYAMELTKIFAQVGLPYEEDWGDEFEIVSMNYRFDVGESVRILYLFHEELGKVEMFDFATVLEHKKEKMLNLLNEFNKFNIFQVHYR